MKYQLCSLAEFQKSAPHIAHNFFLSFLPIWYGNLQKVIKRVELKLGYGHKETYGRICLLLWLWQCYRGCLYASTHYIVQIGSFLLYTNCTLIKCSSSLQSLISTKNLTEVHRKMECSCDSWEYKGIRLRQITVQHKVQ